MHRRSFLQMGLGGASALAAGGAAATVLTRPEAGPDVEAREFARPGAGAARVVWSGQTHVAATALTFDDGPHEGLTPAVADRLAERGVQATFFLIGTTAERHPDLVRRLVDEGHEIGNHTWSHRSMAYIDADSVRDEVLRGAEAIERITGTPTRWFRSPRGVLNGAVLRAVADLGQDVAMWSAGPEAGLLHDPDRAATRLLAALEPGAIYCFHDGTSGRVDEELERRRFRELPVLERLLAGIDRAGFDTVTLSALDALPRPAVD